VTGIYFYLPTIIRNKIESKAKSYNIDIRIQIKEDGKLVQYDAQMVWARVKDDGTIQVDIEVSNEASGYSRGLFDGAFDIALGESQLFSVPVQLRVTQPVLTVNPSDVYVAIAPQEPLNLPNNIIIMNDGDGILDGDDIDPTNPDADGEDIAAVSTAAADRGPGLMGCTIHKPRVRVLHE